MKYENIIYTICAIIVITGSVMKILHLAHGNTVMFYGIIATAVFQALHVAQLKKRVKQLESKNSIS
jgi:branched-subunit amino acid ABC-type transport system permease component